MGRALESMQAYAMDDCCRGGKCPICNPPPPPLCARCIRNEVEELGDYCEDCEKEMEGEDDEED